VAVCVSECTHALQTSGRFGAESGMNKISILEQCHGLAWYPSVWLASKLQAVWQFKI